MASSSSSSQLDDPAAAARRTQQQQQRKPPLLMLLPLIYAPVLPLIRIGLRHNPVWRDRLFYGVLAGAFAHGTYLILAYVKIKYVMLLDFDALAINGSISSYMKYLHMSNTQ
ncbi:hypothetical protein PR202_ga11435 [Eleusine coracana subsp. coracana]|uniref:Uncharacterized protein n=1 Tax=Eleusine coracana subsp. coracana TaxID=191504 RepID=A0AAV5C9H0_ELECO|nr:hypothetical protein PR202_ga11435 [Eleusine coracana subsp. coracana]